METRLLGYEHATSVIEIASWANELIGKEVRGLPGYRVVRVIHFQVVYNQNDYDAVILVEVMEYASDTEQITLRAEDVAVIEELTSTVGDEP
jgi:hypothetical protein